MQRALDAIEATYIADRAAGARTFWRLHRLEFASAAALPLADRSAPVMGATKAARDRPGGDWDSERDQLARNLEAAAAIARRDDRDFCVVVCHEIDLRPDEARLVAGYRDGTVVSGMPHVEHDERALFRERIGTLTWSAIADEWCGLRELPELSDLA